MVSEWKDQLIDIPSSPTSGWSKVPTSTFRKCNWLLTLDASLFHDLCSPQLLCSRRFHSNNSFGSIMWKKIRKSLREMTVQTHLIAVDCSWAWCQNVVNFRKPETEYCATVMFYNWSSWFHRSSPSNNYNSPSISKTCVPLERTWKQQLAKSIMSQPNHENGGHGQCLQKVRTRKKLRYINTFDQFSKERTGVVSWIVRDIIQTKTGFQWRHCSIATKSE